MILYSYLLDSYLFLLTKTHDFIFTASNLKLNMVNKNKSKLNYEPSNARKKRRSIIQTRISNTESSTRNTKTSKPEYNASPSTSKLQSPLYVRTPLADIRNTNGITSSIDYNSSSFNSPQANLSKSHQFYQSPSYTVIPQPLKPFNPFDLHPTCLSSNNLTQSPFITPTTNKPTNFTYFTQHQNITYQTPLGTQCTQPSTANKPTTGLTKTAKSVHNLGVNLMEKFSPTLEEIQSSQTTHSSSYNSQLPEDINDLSDEEHSKASTESESDDSESHDSDSDNSSESDDEWEVAGGNDTPSNNNQSRFTGKFLKL
jgi:hypothetical protein